MVQAAADLPDPLEQTADTAVADVDDLLARLAGDEIDRLLAESEVERAPGLVEEGGGPSTAAGVQEVIEPPVSEQLDLLFAELQAGRAGEAIDPIDPAGERGLAVGEVEGSGGPAREQPIEVEQETVPAEQTRPGAEARPETADAAPVEAALPERVAAEARAGERPPLLIRLLEMINSPVAGCSPVAREAVGKVAIITLLNAVALLLYVLLFR